MVLEVGILLLLLIYNFSSSNIQLLLTFIQLVYIYAIYYLSTIKNYFFELY